MSLIITNKKTLKNTAIITLKNIATPTKTEKKGDLTILYKDDEVIGLNVFNFDSYFAADEGAHTINQEQIDAIKKMGYEISDSISKFTIGEVIKKEAHPKSNKLYLLKVNVGKELQIVTNASNAEVGKKVVVARIGATLPSGLAIVKSKVMGIESEGMLCGGETLGKEKTDGVLLVDGKPGEAFIL